VELEVLLTAGAHALPKTDTLVDQVSASDIPEQIDWQTLHVLSQQHGMEPLLIRYLQQTSSERLPPSFATKIGERLAAIQAENLAKVAELQSILEVFQDKDIPMLVYKGPVVASRVYGTLALRTYGDIDLLVPPEKDQRARAALQERGYQHQTTNGPVAQAVFRRPNQQPSIDLHTSAIPEFFPFTYDFSDLYNRRTMIDVGGTAVPALSAGDAFLIHSIHGAKHHWFRVEWVLATALLAQQVTDLGRTFAAAEELECERMLLLGLALAHQLFDAPLPEPSASLLARNSADTAVVQTASREIMDWIFHEEWAQQNVKRTHIADFRLRSRLLSSRSAKMQFWIRALTNPRAEDIDWITLPDRLWPLYRVLRPARLLWDYRKTLVKR
jgi:hypothetical protein